jgi:hypothetical protein
MYTLKSILRRGSLLSAAGAMLVAAVMPATAAFADALNPLTERSLMLSSSAPGFVDTDGSGNSFAAPNATNGNFAPAGSGPNGKKTGETFAFKVSSTADISGFDLQYCTKAAGKCVAPGNNQGDNDPNKDGDDSDSTRAVNDPDSWKVGESDFNVETGFTEGAGAGQFQVFVGGVAQSGWAFVTTNKENADHADPKTGKNNYITLAKTSGVTRITNGQQVKIVFKASETVYITNPGKGSFFTKINTYKTSDPATFIPGGANNVDGGVTVANVMTDSIHITTKVLETMAFSVGTQNRDNVVVNCDNPSANTNPNDDIPNCEQAGSVHGTCYPIQNVNGNRLNLGDKDAEYSLSTDKGYDVYSYWRLSSNSSGGASVYYSGNTLANTVGDEIKETATEQPSTPGTEQFGLGFVDPNKTINLTTGVATAITPAADYTGAISNSKPFVTTSDQVSGVGGYSVNQTAATDYDEATGTLDNGDRGAGTAKFKFKKSSLLIPELIAQENTDVISCATAKMRYVGNIAADTPAGVYTTKVNYLASPQY